MTGDSKVKAQALDAKKRIIAKKAGGTVIGRPNSWKKSIEYRNGEHELDAVMFGAKDKKLIAKTYKADNTKDPNNWLI